jgi:hypothetical protein
MKFLGYRYTRSNQQYPFDRRIKLAVEIVTGNTPATHPKRCNGGRAPFKSSKVEKELSRIV